MASHPPSSFATNDIQDDSKDSEELFLCFCLSYSDGSWADVELIRSLAWIAEQDARVGGTVEIRVPECGIEGRAELLSIGPCPAIEQGPGRVVTGRFVHHAATVVDLQVEGLAEPIGVTRNHLFWSADRREFVRADQLQPGEQLSSLDGTAAVESIVPRPGVHTVYNLEVQGDHVYHVAQSGVLVHNGVACETIGKPKPREIALGKDIPGGGYKTLADQTGASRWQNWAEDGITRSVDSRFGRAYHQAAERAERIHSSLDGIDDVEAAVQAGRRGIVSGNMTNAETGVFVWPDRSTEKTSFYRNGTGRSLPILMQNP